MTNVTLEFSTPVPQSGCRLCWVDCLTKTALFNLKNFAKGWSFLAPSDTKRNKTKTREQIHCHSFQADWTIITTICIIHSQAFWKTLDRLQLDSDSLARLLSTTKNSYMSNQVPLASSIFKNWSQRSFTQMQSSKAEFISQILYFYAPSCTLKSSLLMYWIYCPQRELCVECVL